MKIGDRHSGSLIRGSRWVGLGLALGLLIGAASGASNAEAHDLRIGTRTALSATVTAVGTRVSVDGFLRDNVGQGIEGQAIRIDFRDVREPTLQISRDVRTDRTGRFYLNARLAPGRYTGVAFFSGRQYYYATGSVDLREIQTSLSDLTLNLVAPTMARAAGGEFAVTVTASSDRAPVGRLPLELTIGERTRRISTDEGGTTTVMAVVGQTNDPELAVSARFPGSPDYRAATATARVRVIEEPRLTSTAHSLQSRAERGVAITGRAFDKRGPLRHRTVEVLVRQDGTEPVTHSCLTDDRGAFSLFLPEQDLIEGPLSLRARIRVPHSEAIESAPLRLTVHKTGLGLLPWVLFVVAAGTASAAVLLSWRQSSRRRRPKVRKTKRARARTHEARHPRIEPLDPAERPPPVPLTASDIFGVLWNTQTDEPVTTGQVAIVQGDTPIAETRSGADGQFALMDLPDGALTLRVKRKGFLSAEAAVEIPHGGELSSFRFGLTPVRVVVRMIYVEVVQDVVWSEPSWGTETPRQVYELLLSAIDEGPKTGARPEGLAAFRDGLQRLLSVSQEGAEPLDAEALVLVITNLIEEVYYSGRDHDESLVTVAEGVAKRVRELAGERP